MKTIFTPACSVCGREAARIELLSALDSAVIAHTSQPLINRHADRGVSEQWYLRYDGPGGGSTGHPVSERRAQQIMEAFAGSPDPVTLREAFYDRAGLCAECGEFYCRKHWSLSVSGYGTCPKGHGQSLDPHWSPNFDDDDDDNDGWDLRTPERQPDV